VSRHIFFQVIWCLIQHFRELLYDLADYVVATALLLPAEVE